jgi:hypothetical protein
VLVDFLVLPVPFGQLGLAFAMALELFSGMVYSLAGRFDGLSGQRDLGV